MQLSGNHRSRDPPCLSEILSLVPEVVVCSFGVCQTRYTAVLGIILPKQSMGVPASVLCD